jgi:hypothetical protein
MDIGSEKARKAMLDSELNILHWASVCLIECSP